MCGRAGGAGGGWVGVGNTQERVCEGAGAGAGADASAGRGSWGVGCGVWIRVRACGFG